MFNPFSKLGKLFSRKKKDFAPPERPQQQVQPPPSQPAPEPIVEEVKIPPKPAPSADRPQVLCKTCGAPNDNFVRVCWLCKKEL